MPHSLTRSKQLSKIDFLMQIFLKKHGFRDKCTWQTTKMMHKEEVMNKPVSAISDTS